MKITETRVNGDFRSEDCTTLLKQADIVVTNPPFSLFRDFFKWLMDNKKDFIIVGNQNAISYKEIFPYLREDKARLGSQTGCKKMEFVDADNGDVLKPFGNICWYTSLNLQKHHDPLLLTEKYSPDRYPKYDNYDAIEVSKVNEIPCDYYGVMGVPITYMYKHNPDQFDIVALRKNPDGTVEPWTVEREREFNDTILSSLDSRSDEERRRKTQWEDYLRTNPNTKETPVDICYPDIKNEKGYDRAYLKKKRMYERILIRRRANN